MFRRHGYEGVSIDRLMDAAGLTRGGFYAHFASKEALFTAVIARDYGLQKTLRRARKGEMGAEVGAAEVLAYYLDAKNREEISASCPMATLTSDIRRVGGAPAEALTDKFRELVAELGKATGDRRSALAAAATCIGAATLSSALSDERLVRELLRACREQLQKNLAGASAS